MNLTVDNRMPYTIPYSFTKFLDDISVKGNHVQTADTRRNRIVELLGDAFTILEAFPTGSLVRDTALRGHADVDVMVVLHYGKHIENKSPKQVLENVRNHLSTYNAKLVRKNGQAVTLYFTTWPCVDIVPTKRVDSAGVFSHYEIPDMNDGTWIKTNPRVHDISIGNTTPARRQLIQMIKTWNHAHSEYLQSFHIEVLVLLADYVNANDWTWTLYKFFENALSSLQNYYLLHPAGGHGFVDSYLSSSDRQAAIDRVERARQLAFDAWYAVYPPRDDTKSAIENYRIIFGNQFPAYG